MRNILITVGLVITSILLSSYSCRPRINNRINNKIEVDMVTKTKEIYFAGGCFWGTEHFFKQIKGVTNTTTGYANGNIKNPNYRDVSTGKTGFAETVKVVYDPQIVDISMLIDLYFKTIDPTSLNKQGNDKGTQYRTGIFYTNKEDENIVKEKVANLAKQYYRKVVVEVKPLENFYDAESYHQDYLDKNPEGYCHISSALFDLARDASVKPEKTYAKKDKEALKKQLTSLQYNVTQNNATERPFDNEYNDEFREGIYVDITTDEPLFVSSDKFESGCGWPSFSKPINSDLIKELNDNSLGLARIEVRSNTGDTHLGHVFNDGPKDKGGLRYCINSASLKFIPLEDMKAKGYESYIPLVKRNK